MPDMDLTSVIENAVSEAEAGGDVPDALPDEGAGDATSDVETGDGDADADPAAEPAPEGDEPAEAAADADAAPADKEPAKEPATKELSEVEKILEAAGIKAPAAGQKDNKIPYSRTVKIIGNALKKQADSHSAAVADLTTKHTAAEARAAAFERADQLASTDPDRYMTVLASINPAYKKFLTPGGAVVGEQPAKVVEKLAEKAPGPDVKFEDGSFGYSPEQAQKREDWIIATAEERAFNRAKTMYEERFGPIEKAAKTREAAAADAAVRLPRIRAEIAEQKEIWGDQFPADGSADQLAVSKLLRETKCSLASALNRVLLPKVRQSRDAMRADILKEQNARPAAARKNAPAAKKSVAVDPNVVRNTDDVIRDAIAAAGLEL